MTDIERVLNGESQWAITCSDVLAGLRLLPDACVHCVVTSPPYWGLRDYGTARWEGGDQECSHTGKVRRTSPSGSQKQASNAGAHAVSSGDCACGAIRIDQQIGLEPTFTTWLDKMVEVFSEVRRVLHPSGTVWCNVGDSYNAYNGGAGPGSKLSQTQSAVRPQLSTGYGLRTKTLKPKDLMMMPARLAIALQDDGWWLRSDIIWHKPNAMPSSQTDRPTSSHEHIFLLAKRRSYFFDLEAATENSVSDHLSGNGYKREPRLSFLDENGPRGNDEPWQPQETRMIRDVWTIPTQAFEGSHFATFPTELVRRCIALGSSEKGVCPTCGAPWTRLVKKSGGTIGKGAWHPGRDAQVQGHLGGTPAAQGWRGDYRVEKMGWQPGCTHGLPPIPSLILDPFLGSGTSIVVALRLGRRAIGIELSYVYCKIATDRIIGDAPMLNRPSLDEGDSFEQEALL